MSTNIPTILSDYDFTNSTPGFDEQTGVTNHAMTKIDELLDEVCKWGNKRYKQIGPLMEGEVANAVGDLSAHRVWKSGLYELKKVARPIHKFFQGLDEADVGFLIKTVIREYYESQAGRSRQEAYYYRQKLIKAEIAERKAEEHPGESDVSLYQPPRDLTRAGIPKRDIV